MTSSINLIDKYHQVTESVKNNLHFLNISNATETDISNLVGFNSRIVLSNCQPFLEAVRNEIGGEILEDSVIGTFLYYGEEKN